MTSKHKRTPEATSEPTTKSQRRKAVPADAAPGTQSPPPQPDHIEPAESPSALHADVAASEAPVQAAAGTPAAKPPEPSVTPAHKLSALDAAAKVLAETGQAMSCGELIAAMAAKGYWQSPKGRTPAGTLYSGILRELQIKGPRARFCKSERGKFRFNNAL